MTNSKRTSDDNTDGVASTSNNKRRCEGIVELSSMPSVQVNCLSTPATEMHANIANDIFLFLNRSLSDNEKNIVLTNLWTPSDNYRFPLLDINKKRGLRFQHIKWLKNFPWLCYSQNLEGAFCRYCVAFSTSGGVGSQPLGYLIIKPLKNWKKAKEDLSYHNSLQYHKTSLLKAEMFLKIFVKNVPSIIDTLDNDRTKQIKLNRLKLTPIIECIILCGRQELALRGHRDSGSINFNDASNSNDLVLLSTTIVLDLRHYNNWGD